MNQKMVELELSLYNCKQNVQIDSITLKFHAEIEAAARRAKEQGRTLKPEDLGDLARNEDFLNALQAGVNTWVKDIQKVTKLERIEKMPNNADTAQEIKFWQELESELRHIDEQLKSEEAG